jgi:hypothetical protein
MKLTEEQQETLADLRDTPAWDYFANTFAVELLEARSVEVLEYAEHGATVPAAYAKGRRDGVLDLIVAVYGDSKNVPEQFKQLRRKV